MTRCDARTARNISAEDHYVPQLNLKRFSVTPGKILEYRLLVPDERHPIWRRKSIKGMARHRHLYTRIVGPGEETDEIEKWLASEFESPAERAIDKAISGLRLERDDWKILIRFLACQIVRTPAHFLELHRDLLSSVQGILDDALEDTVARIEGRTSVESADITSDETECYGELIPLHIKRGGEAGTHLQAEIAIGRGMWFFVMKHALTSTISVLHRHRWSLAVAPADQLWFTSDDPVVRLNFYGENKYDFRGGWGSKGTEIFLPLSPHILLYTQVGYTERRGRWVAPQNFATTVRRIIAEHAHRHIFSSVADPEVIRFRRRVVDARRCHEEGQMWNDWHRSQSEIENIFLANHPSEPPGA
jgi:Protein of unknown function (DUF4238)